jgi:fibronectin type 3 domain-containing protein
MRRAFLVIVSLAVSLAAPAGAYAATVFESAFAANALAANGLVAAYSMDQGSGTAVPDVSGTGNNGTLSGATWATAGKFGGALSFNGSSAIVTVPDAASLDLTTGMTTEAWVRPTVLGGDWRTVLFKDGPPGGMVYDLYAHGTAATNVPTAELNIGGDKAVSGPAALPLNAWTHLAATYDGATMRLYVNGAQVAQRAQTGSIPASTGALRIGGNTVYREYFGGLIDEVRVYNRALTAAEIGADMNAPIGPQDSQPPTAPSNLTATGSLTSAQLSWTAATDDTAVVRYNVHRSTSSGFTPSAANRIAQPTGTSYTDTPSGGTYYYKVTAEDAAGNISPASNEASATAGDVSAPSAPGLLTAIGTIGKATLTWGAASDNVGVIRYSVHRGTSSGFTPSAANRIAQPTGTSYTDATVPGTYFYKVTAEDAAGNIGAASNEASATVTADTQAPTAPAGLSAGVTGSTVNLTWTAASDNVGILRYNVHRSTTSGFTPSAANRIAQPTGTSAADGNLAAGTYYYKVTAEDAAGNVSPASSQASAVVSVVAPSGLVAAYGFDEGAGTTTADQSGNGNTGSLSNTLWAAGGKYGAALSFNGGARVNVADSTSLHFSTGMTFEAWVKPVTINDWRTVVLKERTGYYAGALYASTDTNRPSAHVFTSGDHELRGPAQVPINTWTHLAATYSGSTLALYVNGAQVAGAAATGAIATHTGPLRIGGNAIWGEYFNGLIDEVRVYNRALTATEIQGDMDRSVTVDTTAPTVTAKTPPNGAAGLNVGTVATATFSEPMRASTITASSFTLTDSSDNLVPATVTFDAASGVATLRPQSALQYGASYRATVKGGAGGVTDLAGNPPAADVTWTFTSEASPPQVLVVASASNPFGSYIGEILRNEGLDAFTTLDASLLSAGVLSSFDVVLLGQTSLTAGQVSALTSWVDGGGNLIAMRPDKQLAGLLGLIDAGTTLANAYLKVDASTPPGTGIVSSTIQFHGTADRYALNGARAVAALYSNVTTATANPAVTLRSVGSNGGEAAAFTFDLARSVAYTRQGNPAWAGQERDGIVAVRPNDMFFGAKAGDVQPDWLDTSKIAIPQADEQQRLLVNLITLMERDRMPIPHFWYLPRGEKAAVVMSGDDHSPGNSAGGTVTAFDRFKALSPAGCSVARWECVRSTSYLYPTATITNAQAAGYVADGFEVALHPQVGSCPSVVPDLDDFAAAFDDQLQEWAARYTSVPAPVSSRTHCVEWPDWASEAKIELARGMRMDANYYHYPSAWIGAKPGFMNGGGFPMRFVDVDGTPIDVYQQNTNMTDESGQAFPATVDALLDNAVGPNGYYGAFGANMHTDNPFPHPGAEAIVASAQAHSVPVISYKQLLTWTDGRNSSTIRGLNWTAGTFTFVTTVGAGADGLQTMLPVQGPSGTLSGLTCGGATHPYSVETVKGIQYARFATITGTCRATYS